MDPRLEQCGQATYVRRRGICVVIDRSTGRRNETRVLTECERFGLFLSGSIPPSLHPGCPPAKRRAE